MKIKLILALCSIVILLSQDRSVIFYTGLPVGSDGHDIYFDGEIGNAVADRFTPVNDYVLEAFSVWCGYSSDGGHLTAQIRDDIDGVPGNVMGEWTINLLPGQELGFEYLTSTVSDCINLISYQNYWLVLQASDTTTQAVWQYPESTYYTFTTSSDGGNTWTVPESGQVGAAKVWAEQIYVYDPEYLSGDVNFDITVDILDIVLTVGYILGDIEFDGDQIMSADMNHDLSVDILDIVLIVDVILNGPEPMPDYSLEDINPNSPYFGVDIGPSYFDGYVSGYYFGKAG